MHTKENTRPENPSPQPKTCREEQQGDTAKRIPAHGDFYRLSIIYLSVFIYLEPGFMWNKTKLTTTDGICLSKTIISKKFTALNSY